MTTRQGPSTPLSQLAQSRDQPLDRVLQVLEAVATASQPLSMAEIGARCGLPAPTVHRLVSQLERRGLLKRVLGSKRLAVGTRLLSLGVCAVNAALRIDIPHQVLLALANHLREHCHIGMRVENEVIYVDTVHAQSSSGLHFEPGRRSPLHCTSIGKLYLAEMAPDDLATWISLHARFAPPSHHAVTPSTKLAAYIDEVRHQQWAASNEELAVGVVGCAVPIRSRTGRLLAGLGISVPTARISFDQLSQFRPAMEAAAAEISRGLAASEVESGSTSNFD